MMVRIHEYVTKPILEHIVRPTCAYFAKKKEEDAFKTQVEQDAKKAMTKLQKLIDAVTNEYYKTELRAFRDEVYEAYHKYAEKNELRAKEFGIRIAACEKRLKDLGQYIDADLGDVTRSLAELRESALEKIAAKGFQNCLGTPEGEKRITAIVRYVVKEIVTAETVKEIGIGFVKRLKFDVPLIILLGTLSTGAYIGLDYKHKEKVREINESKKLAHRIEIVEKNIAQTWEDNLELRAENAKQQKEIEAVNAELENKGKIIREIQENAEQREKAAKAEIAKLQAGDVAPIKAKVNTLEAEIENAKSIGDQRWDAYLKGTEAMSQAINSAGKHEQTDNAILALQKQQEKLEGEIKRIALTQEPEAEMPVERMLTRERITLRQDMEY